MPRTWTLTLHRWGHDDDPVDDAEMTYAVSENTNATLVTTSVTE